MSTTWLGPAWWTEVGSPTRKSVLMVFADHADEDGRSWPKVATISKKTELSERAVRAAIKGLEADGFISVEEQWSSGKQVQNLYKLEIKPITPKESGVQEVHPSGRGGVQEVHPWGAGGAPTTRTLIEPSLRTTPARGAARRREVGRAGGTFQHSQPDDPTASSDESPALGASQRPARAERNAVAERRGTSGYGIAMRLERGLRDAGVSGSAATVDKGILGKRLSALVKAGTHTYELLGACVDVYVAAPTRYRSGDLKGWTGFLAAMPKLEADAVKLHQSTAPSHELYGEDPYAGVTE